MPIKKWDEFLLEYVNYNKVKEIALEISNIITYEDMYVLRNVKFPKLFRVVNDRLIKVDEEIYNQEILIKNYLRYFKNTEIHNSEIIKIEYRNYNWIIIFLGYNKNEKYSVLSYSPDLNDYDLIEKINNYLESKNFQILKNKLSVKKITNSFLNQLIKVFRDMSGRYYSYDALPEIKEEFEEFKEANKEEWSYYERWKYKNLGKSLKCVRFMDLSPSYEVTLVSGKTKEVKDLTKKDLFYYPISGREFSQWSEIDSDDSVVKIKKDLQKGILSSGNFGFTALIPTKNIVLTNKLLLYNFSPNVYEREVVVEHDIINNHDKHIICKIV
jgi:hypothetical protein